MPTLADHLNWRVKGWWHARVVRAVLDTPPLTPRDDGVILFSMVGSSVVAPALVAIKSLASHLGRGRVVLLDDGTLTDADRVLLHRHLGGAEIRDARAVDTGPCPRGGTWERLLTILDLRADAYVIQLDSDTITVGPVPEIAAAIDAGRSFSLKGEADAALSPVDRFVATLPPLPAPMHIQKAAERAMAGLDLPMLEAPRYFRGCSGFAGFAPSDSGRALAEAFSRANARVLGDARWAEWGTEQVTSNFVVANEPDPLLLPYARYLNFWNVGVPADARFVHFVGTCRFDGMTYMDETRRAIAALGA